VIVSCREVSRTACLELLGQASIGRIILNPGSLPDVVPVSYCLAGETVVFGAPSGSRLPRTPEGAIASFQVDAFDTDNKRGWHVLAVGVFRPPLDPDEVAVAGAVVPESWPTGEVAERVYSLEILALSGHVVDSAHEPD
jgi:uncharacterized protein